MFTKNIVFNPLLKRVARCILSNPIITRNPFYQHYYQKRMKRIMKRCEKTPDRVRLENTNVCTAHCSFCPHQKMKRPKGYMDMGLFKKIVDQIVVWGVKEVVIQGFGNPLSDPYFFERVSYCFTRGVVKIQTNVNSIHINKRIAHYLLNCGLTELFISCNKKGEEKVRYLLSQRKTKYPKIYLSFIKGETVPYKNIKADGVSISYPHNWGGAQKKKASPSFFAKDPCRLLWVTMYITWDGYTHLCCMDYEASYLYGNVISKPLKELWKKNPYRKLHKKHKWEQLPICKECSYNRHNKSPWWV